MLLEDLVFSIFFLAQTGIGLLGNSALLLFYVNIFTSQPHQIKTTDLIITHLTVVNAVMLLTQMAPGMVLAYKRDIMDVVGCQIVLYMRRVARGLSICITCLLSVFQAITISPNTSCWAWLKRRAPKFILPSIPFFWISCLLLDINIMKMTEATRNATISTDVNRKFCAGSLDAVDLEDTAVISALTVRDVFSVILMSWSSGYMVMVFLQHRKQVQHIHSTSHSLKSSPVSRATQTILILVFCFVTSYYINSAPVLLIYIVEDASTLHDPGTFVGSCSPFSVP
uniref:Vomeronasal type-1 receptor n=1 Tax=Ornithorhynchus anatinus TaxID=9258 RepID=F6YV29_ORNAN